MHVTVSILPWAKTHKARNNWKCAHCQGVIPKGTVYQRFVMRDGEFKKGWRYSLRFHLDCDNKWWQPPGANRCAGLATLPGRLPTPEEDPEQRGSIVLSLIGKTLDDGMLTCVLPHVLGQRVLHASPQINETAVTNMQNGLELLLRAFEAAAGNRKRSRHLSEILDQLQVLTDIPEAAPFTRLPE